MNAVFAMMSVSLDGYVSGPNGGPGLGLDVDEPIFDWYYSGDLPSRQYPDHGFSLDRSNVSVVDYAGARTGAVVARGEIVVNLRPVLLGGGVRLFRDLPAAVRLEQTSVVVNHGVTHLTYDVVRPGPR